ncbi:interleukin-11 receptor subunit alpha isoform X1 [Pseudonaja textilis]|uniref:interleukin-11 receptor subunit alpha isoform X1 n=1 Tax=Pseudonaja textilis TaxID=8673 RepID=UPI000EA96F0C|nr:interleukin-11 receptor subunit alpha isoform X1 [Pseudonaja textilis]XP_026576579.1 interleukin-11 receptor subunit alpha isoform X1 [Pseudonaja textilis]XP_026576580.1 interleukin-11 receptor subunit alpha isoform X1 [Pseudonaja textilis]
MLSRTGWVSRGLVLLAMVLATASVPTSGEWGEEGVTYAELGRDVALTCPGGDPNSTTRWQRHGGSGLPSDSRVQQGQLLLSHVDPSSEGTYSCQNGAGLPLGSVVLRVGRLPGPPSVSCRASNYENFTCFWTPSVETHLPTRYITSYLSPVKSVGPCVQDPGRPLTCTVSKSEYWSLYRVNVTEVNPLGSSFTLLNIIAQRITKPDPPEHVRVEPVPQAPRRLRVSWEYPSSWRKELSFQLHFRLRYRPVLHDSWSTIETSNMSEEITDAIMGLEHTVQVSAKDYLDAGSWSEWSPEVRAWPAAGQVTEPSQASPDTIELDPPAEEPSPVPDNEPVAGQGDSVEKVATLVSLGVFAFFALVALLLFAFLVWIRAKKQSKEADKHQELLAGATHLKALPKGQIL